MTHSGTCDTCAAPILAAHEYCVICGRSVAVPSAAPTPGPVERATQRRGIPVRPQVALFAGVLTFGFGSLIGAGVGPGVDTLLAAASPTAAATDAQLADTGETDPPGSGGGGSSGGGAPPPGPAASAPLPAAPIPTPPVTPLPEQPAPEVPPVADPDDPEVPPADDTTTVEGTVVRVNENAGSYSVASGGLLSTVHAKDLPDPGDPVKVSADPLFNGTLEEAGGRVSRGKPADSATFSGTVTWVAPDGSRYALSSSGASVLVTVPAASGGKEAEVPELASSVTVEVDVESAPAADADGNADGKGRTDGSGDDGAAAEGPAASPAGSDQEQAISGACTPEAAYPDPPVDPGITLTQRSVNVEFEELSFASAEGIVQAVCDDENEIVISADDLRQSQADLTLTVPDDVDASKFEPGESVLVNLDPSPEEDGTITLSGLAGDMGTDGADDEKLGQGDLAD